MDDPFEQHRAQLAGVTLAVYSTSWCFDCQRLKSFLSRHKVAFSNVNIGDLPNAAAKLEAETGKRGVPFVLVNNATWVRGYHLDQPGRFNPDLFVAELAAAL